MSHRAAQIAGIIRTVVASQALVIPPSVARVVSVIDVRVSPDLGYADVSIAAVEGAEGAIRALRSMHGALRRDLAAKLRLHRVPTLRFRIDKDGDRAHRIDLLLSELARPASPKRSTKRKKSAV